MKIHTQIMVLGLAISGCISLAAVVAYIDKVEKNKIFSAIYSEGYREIDFFGHNTEMCQGKPFDAQQFLAKKNNTFVKGYVCNDLKVFIHN
jgi:hypothetical protein